MKLVLLILAIVVFLVMAIIALAGGTWGHVRPPHRSDLAGALFAASFLPIP